MQEGVDDYTVDKELECDYLADKLAIAVRAMKEVIARYDNMHTPYQKPCSGVCASMLRAALKEMGYE